MPSVQSNNSADRYSFPSVAHLSCAEPAFGGRLFGTSDSFQVLGSAIETNVSDFDGTGPGVCTARWGLSFDWGL